MMQALRKLSLCFASVLAFGLIAGRAEAKRAEYEINGTTYTYSTKNRVQVELAGRRIEAASRVAEIKARAVAEAASNPFVRLFGSRTEAEMAAAEAELQRLLAEPNPLVVRQTQSSGRFGGSFELNAAAWPPLRAVP
jgi:hypothetical protein